MVAKQNFEEKEDLHCHFWFNSSKTMYAESKAVDIDYLFAKHQLKQEHFQQEQMWPVMVTCKLPEKYSGQVPDSVSLTKIKCDLATNNIRYV